MSLKTSPFPVDLALGLQMLFEIVPGVHRILPVGVMGVPAALAGAASGKVLHPGIDAFIPPAVGTSLSGLKAVAVRLSHQGGELPILPEGITEPQPSRLRPQINLWGKRRCDPQRTVLSGRCPAEILHHLRVEARRHGKAAGPVGHPFFGPCLPLHPGGYAGLAPASE